VAALERPRRVMLMVQAGRPSTRSSRRSCRCSTRATWSIDGGNSHYRRHRAARGELREHGLHYLGTGVSGGEEGARYGPSIMPGGPEGGVGAVRPVFEAIAAKVDGEPCVAWMGEDGLGPLREDGPQRHRVRRHAADRRGLPAHARRRSAWTPEALHETFERWNEGVLDSYLIEITRDILGTYDDDGQLVLDLILDRAGQKGTGRWTAVGGARAGQPVTLITEAVFARSLSALKDQRERAAAVLTGPSGRLEGVDRERFVATSSRRSTPARSSATRRATC
jgi:6-phosphogluconate dehydrogenase